MRRSLCVLGVLFLASCQDQGPRLPGGAGPQFSLSSNPYFGFTSPVPPGSSVPVGDFHQFAQPRLTICKVSGASCNFMYESTLTSSTSSSLQVISRNMVAGTYEAGWTNLNALRNSDPSAIYTLTVHARPFTGGSEEFLGEIRVALTNVNGAVLANGNTLPVKFTIKVGAFCLDDDCEEVYVDNTSGGNIIVEQLGSQDIGTLGLSLPPNFLCGENETDCDEGAVVLTIRRYRGPDRCIPVSYNAIQWEACVEVRAEPYGVKVSGVKVGICFDNRAERYADTGHLRLLKVKEDQNNVVLPGTVEDLNASFDAGFFMQTCGPEWNPDLGQASAAPVDALSRFASRAADALRPIAALLAPRPLHARLRSSRGPFVASLEDFSRLGLVLPVASTFDRDNAAGLENTLLPASSQPRVRVMTTTIPESSYATDPHFGVSDVQVTFSVTQGGGSHPAAAVTTDAQGYAVASWTLGPGSQNPQKLLAAVGYPAVDFQDGSFPNPTSSWTTHTFTATALQYTVSFLSPLGDGSSTGNITSGIAPSVRICRIANPAAASTAPGQGCAAPDALVLTLTTSLKGGVWETAWKSDKNTIGDSLYRIDVMLNGVAIGSVLARRGGGGGGIDPAGTYQFQNGSNIPIKLAVKLP
ncbi:hypothetical protein BH23GEM9_BH23GEM9_37760 [soil metagenome]